MQDTKMLPKKRFFKSYPNDNDNQYYRISSISPSANTNEDNRGKFSTYFIS